MANNKIKKLRSEANITLKGLRDEVNEYLVENKISKDGKTLKITDGQISKYENNLLSPRHDEIWEALSAIFNVSVPYLKGDSEIKSPMPSSLVDQMFLKSSMGDEEGVVNAIDEFKKYGFTMPESNIAELFEQTKINSIIEVSETTKKKSEEIITTISYLAQTNNKKIVELIHEVLKNAVFSSGKSDAKDVSYYSFPLDFPIDQIPIFFKEDNS